MNHSVQTTTDFPDGINYLMSKAGVWDGTRWVNSWEEAQKYPPYRSLTQSVFDAVEKETGLRCWYFYRPPDPVP